MNDKANDCFKNGLRKNLLGLYPEAAADYSKAIGIDPSFAEAYLKRGILRYKLLKQYEESFDDFNKVVELDPACPAGFLYRGIVKCHLLQFSDALADFDRAIELDPNEERAYFNRGKSKYMLKYDKEEVCADLNRAICLHSTAAADIMKLFYGDNQEAIRETIALSVEEKTKKKVKG